nr:MULTISPECIES: HAMP domain-containing sensor histidine kinase [unclassified Clostridium]
MIFISFAGILITYYVVGKALSPLTQLSKKVEQIDENSLDTQLIVPSSNDEIHKLSLAFNSMMLKLKTSFSSQKTFASNAAHELKTPLSIMKSSLQVLCLDENPTKEDYKENVVVMLESVDRLSEIINELLLISSPIEQNTLIQFDLLIENSIEKLQTSAEKRNIKITSVLENTAIYSNEVLLNSIVENLLSNAIKYNKDEGEIFISLKNHQNGINLELSDTGIGISEDQFSLIFEAFYRVDSSRLKNISGCGLGLQIVKSALEKINGTIDVKSSIGEGTTFNVFIPKKNS